MAKVALKRDMIQMPMNVPKFLSTFNEIISGMIDALIPTFITGYMTFFQKVFGENFIILFNIANLAHRQINDNIMATIKTISGIPPSFSNIYENGTFNKFSPPTII